MELQERKKTAAAALFSYPFIILIIREYVYLQSTILFLSLFS